MSYSEQTPFLGLPIRSASDKFNTMDNNEAFRTTDTKVKEAVDNAAAATDDATEARTLAQNASDAVAGVVGDISAIDATLDEHAERLVILSNRVTSQGQQIALKSNSTSIADLYDNTATYAVDDVVMYQGQLYICVTAVTTAEDFDVDKWTPTTIEALLSTPSGQIAASAVSYTDTLTQLGATDVQAAIVALKTLIDNIGGGRMLDFANKIVHTATFTTQSDCVIVINAYNISGSVDIGGVAITTNANNTQMSLEGVPSGTVVTLTGNFASDKCVYEIPYL